MTEMWISFHGKTQDFSRVYSYKTCFWIQRYSCF